MVWEKMSGKLEVEKLSVFTGLGDLWSEVGALDPVPSIVNNSASFPAGLCLSRVLSCVLSSPPFHFF